MTWKGFFTHWTCLDELMAVGPPLGWGPANEPVARVHFPCGRPETGARHGAVLPENQITQARSGRLSIAQVMVRGEQSLEELLLRQPVHLGQGQRRNQPRQRLDNGRDREERRAGVILVTRSAGGMEPGRQLDETFLLQAAEQFAAGDFPEGTVGLAPIPQSAQPTRQRGASTISFQVDQLPDRLQVRWTDATIANG